MEYPFKDLMPLDEVLEREGYYKDWTHLDPEVFYSLTQISDYIKTKGYGVDVRLLIAQLAEHFGLKTTQVVDLGNLLQAEHATLKQQVQQAVAQVNADRNALETQFNQSVAQMEADKNTIVANATVDSEVILARGGKATLGQRLDETTAQLAQTMHILGDRVDGESNDNGRLERLFQKSIGGTCKIPSGTYYIDCVGTTGANRGVAVPSNINIIMEQDAVLKAIPNGQAAYTVLTIYNVENVTITGGKIIGERYEHTGTTGEHGFGINLLHSNNIVIDSVKITDFWGDSIYIGGNNWGVTGDYPRNITVRNCVLQNSRRQGLSMTLGDGVLIENCRLLDINGTAPQHGIDIETNNPDNPCKNVTIRGCYFNGSAVGGLVIGNLAENVTVDGCIFDGNYASMWNCISAKVINSTFLDVGIGLRSSTGVIISNNVINNGGILITTHENQALNNTSITSNIFQNLSKVPDISAISLQGSANNAYNIMISGNTFKDYIFETLYLYTRVKGMSFINNQIVNVNTPPTRWLLLINGEDIKFSNNNIIIENDEQAEVNRLVQFSVVGSSFDSNTFNLINTKVVALYGALNSPPSYDDGLLGATISNTSVKSISDDTGFAINFQYEANVQHKVINNDFSFTDTPYSNMSPSSEHFFYGNILNDTPSD